MITAAWLALAVLSLSFRPVIAEGFFPIFYFLIWITGLMFSPQKAFTISFLGHFIFDLFAFFNILFVVVWVSSGLWSFFISLVKKNNFLLLWMIIIGPFFYFCAFSFIGFLITTNPIYYFTAFPLLFFSIIFINPFFSFLVFFFFVYKNFWPTKANKIMQYADSLR